MGHNTNYKGILKFKNGVTGRQLAKLNKYLGEDCRDHDDWDSGDLTYIDLEIAKDYVGLQYDGTEKSYDMIEKINFLIEEMQKTFPEFSLEGKFLAQGEDIDDRYEIIIEDGIAIKKDMKPSGKKVLCPHCEEHFYIE